MCPRYVTLPRRDSATDRSLIADCQNVHSKRWLIIFYIHFILTYIVRVSCVLLLRLGLYHLNCVLVGPILTGDESRPAIERTMYIRRGYRDSIGNSMP
jgi:hypothetical protein